MPSNISGFPKPFKPLNEPLDSLVGKYEATLVRQGSSGQTIKWMCRAIEGFFYDHPKVKRPEQILITDVEDWKLARLELGHAWNVVRRDCCAISAFYGWLIREGYEVSQPVVIPKYRPAGKPNQYQRNQVLGPRPEIHPTFEEECMAHDQALSR